MRNFYVLIKYLAMLFDKHNKEYKYFFVKSLINYLLF